MVQVVIIADDLTGALDSACAFAARGLRTRWVLQASALAAELADGDADVLCFSTGTRDGQEAQARAVLANVAGLLAGFDGILFKKVDSRLKGHIRAECEALFGADKPFLAAPAIPALGRMVDGGAVTGAGVDAPISVADRVPEGAVIPDTQSAADMLAALPADLGRVHYVGAAGLAHALAQRLAAEGRAAEGRAYLPAIFAIGSRDPVTLAQIDKLGLPPISAENGVVPAVTGGTCLIQLTPGFETVPAAQAGADFAAGVAKAVQALGPKTLFACGGETAQAILAKLQLEVLDVLGEVAPGVPITRCPKTDLTVVTKSGGFGAEGMLVDLLNKFAKWTEMEVTTI